MKSTDRQITPEEVMAWCQEFHITSFIETSAKTSQNVTEAFVMAVRQWLKLERTTENSLRAQGETIDLTRSVQLNQNGRSSCCGGGNNNNQRQAMRQEVLQ